MNIRDRVSTLHPVEIVLNGVPLLAVLVLGYRQRWVAEDAFITLRVVENVLAGHGPVFNIGERVEVYTHPLWFLMVTLLAAPGLRPEYAAVGMGLGLSLVGVAMAQFGAASLTRHLLDWSPSRRTIAVPVGILAFVAVPVVWDFITSGMETGLTFAWLGISFWLLVQQTISAESTEHERRLPLPEALVFGLGPLIRPDLGLFAVTFLIALVVSRSIGQQRRRVVSITLWLTVTFGSIPGIYQIFRMGYFAVLVPNTALAKEAGSANWDRGWEYLNDFSGAYHLWIPLVVLFVGWLALLAQAGKRDRRALPVVVAPTIAALLHALYVVWIGGDFMHGRLLLPALFGCMLPLASVSLELPSRPDMRAILTWSGVGIVALWAVSCALLFRWTPDQAAIRDGIPEGIVNERQFFVEQTGNAHPMTVDDYRGTAFDWVEHGLNMRALAAIYPRIVLTDRSIDPLSSDIDDRVALVVYARSIGVQSHAAGDGVRLIDLLGLGDPLASRMKVVETGRPGHEKELPLVWIHARYADVNAIDPIPEDLEAALDVLQCGDVAALFRAVDDPMTPGRFADNVRLSWRLTSLRIHPDPFVARAEICGAAPDR